MYSIFPYLFALHLNLELVSEEYGDDIDDWENQCWIFRVMEEAKIEKFLGQNFSLWKVQMEWLMIKQDLSIALEGKGKKLSLMVDEEWEKLDKKEKAMIFLSLSSNVLFNVSIENTSKELWDKISSMYELGLVSNKVFIMKRLYNPKMKEVGIVSSHLNEINTLVTKLVLVGISLDYEIKAILVLCLLPNSWEGVVMAVSTFVAAKNKLKFDNVTAIVLSEDMWKKNQ